MNNRNMAASFWNGGPESLVWGCLLVVLGSLAQAYSLAEMGAILPISGAQYHWTYLLAPPRWKYLITWVQGTLYPEELETAEILTILTQGG